MRLSVLDQSVAVADRPHDQSIRNTVGLARHCEALGYERFWVSEHHNHPTIVGTAPEVWILGSSDYGAQVAALFGLPYCYAWFFSDGKGGERAIDLYKRSYRPSARHPAPHSGLCVWALAAPTMEEAQYHLTSRVLSRINRDRGLLGPLVSPDEAAKALAPHDQARIERIRKDSFVGTGPEVMARIVELKERVGVDEMAVVTWTYDEEIRRQSYTELAKAF